MNLPTAILATAVVPWTTTWEFDEPVFRRQVAFISRHLTRSIYLFGTAGEGHAVTETQFDRISAAFHAAAAKHGVAPMLGVISLSLPAIVARIERSVARGFRIFQLSLPSWGVLNDAEVERFFAETCGRFPDCEFHLYNIARTKRVLTGAELARVAAAHPNLVGVKQSTRDPAIVAELLTATPRLRFYFTEAAYMIARRTHDVGLLISTAAAHPVRARAFVTGTDEDRARLWPSLQAVGVALRDTAGGRFHIDGAFDKMLARLHDPEFPLRLLPPYVSADNADFARFRATLPSEWRQG